MMEALARKQSHREEDLAGGLQTETKARQELIL
jgi:hypothetical protein